MILPSVRIGFACALAAASTTHAAETTVAGIEYTTRVVTANSGQTTLAAADMNGDGHADLVLASVDCACVTILLGDGRGDLSHASQTPSGPEPVAIDVADLDEDGKPDLLVTNHETQRLTILTGDGRGGLAPGLAVRIDVAPHPHAALARDLDGDGALDLLIDHRTPGGVAFLAGRGGLHFSAPQAFINVGGDPYRGFVARDLTGDGLIDLVTPNPDHLAVVVNEGGGRFSAPRRIEVDGPFSVVTAAIRDGHALAIVAATDGRRSRLLLFDSAPDALGPLATATLDPGAKNLAAADLDGDGRDEVVATSWSGGVAVFDWNSGLERRDLDPGPIENPWGLTLADFDGDGRADIVLADGAGERVRLYLTSPR